MTQGTLFTTWNTAGMVDDLAASVRSFCDVLRRQQDECRAGIDELRRQLDKLSPAASKQTAPEKPDADPRPCLPPIKREKHAAKPGSMNGYTNRSIERIVKIKDKDGTKRTAWSIGQLTWYIMEKRKINLGESAIRGHACREKYRRIDTVKHPDTGRRYVWYRDAMAYADAMEKQHGRRK